MNWIAADLVHIHDGILAEHWDVIQHEHRRTLKIQASESFARSLSSKPTNDVYPCREDNMSLMNNGLPHLRLAIELNLAAHGTQKFFRWFGAELGDVQRVSLPRHALGGAFWALASLGVSMAT